MAHESTVHLLPEIPINIIICGATQSGKTTLFSMIVKNFNYLYGKDTKIRKLIIVYKHLQPIYLELENLIGKDKTLLMNTFNDDIFSTDTLGSPGDGVAILCLDDVAHLVQNTSTLVDCFVGCSHHLNILTVMLCHNLFSSNHSNWKTCVRNASVTVLMRQPRIGPALKALNQQLYPGKPKALQEAYEMALNDCLKHNKNERGYLVICTCLSCGNSNALLTGLFPCDKKFCYSVI